MWMIVFLAIDMLLIVMNWSVLFLAVECLMNMACHITMLDFFLILMLCNVNIFLQVYPNLCCLCK